MIGRCQHGIVAENHFHRDFDFSMLRSKLSHHSRNLLPDLSLALFRNEATVDENLERIRNDIAYESALRSVDLQSRPHLPLPPYRLRVNSRSPLTDLYSQLLQVLNQRRPNLHGIDT